MSCQIFRRLLVFVIVTITGIEDDPSEKVSVEVDSEMVSGLDVSGDRLDCCASNLCVKMSMSASTFTNTTNLLFIAEAPLTQSNRSFPASTDDDRVR